MCLRFAPFASPSIFLTAFTSFVDKRGDNSELLFRRRSGASQIGMLGDNEALAVARLIVSPTERKHASIFFMGGIFGRGCGVLVCDTFEASSKKSSRTE